MSELKACPFCGGEAAEVDDELSVRFDYPKAVECCSCGSSHVNLDNWNKRPLSKNKWQDFANLHEMSPEQFAKELSECAQAVLAMDLVGAESEKLEILSSQHDGVYKLTFERVIK